MTGKVSTTQKLRGDINIIDVFAFLQRVVWKKVGDPPGFMYIGQGSVRINLKISRFNVVNDWPKER